jgi:hypothetical protein
VPRLGIFCACCVIHITVYFLRGSGRSLKPNVGITCGGAKMSVFKTRTQQVKKIIDDIDEYIKAMNGKVTLITLPKERFDLLQINLSKFYTQKTSDEIEYRGVVIKRGK